MALRRIFASLAAAALLSGCAGGGVGGGGIGFSQYRLIRPQPVNVARGAMQVTPTVRWNRVPRGYNDIHREENWTLNGPLLDSLSFIGGVEHDKRIVQQRRKADRKVPNFRADMSPPEIASMIESFYRIRAGASTFTMTNLAPRTFLGHPGFQFDYDYLGGDEVERRGRAVRSDHQQPLLSRPLRRRTHALFPRGRERIRTHRRERPPQELNATKPRAATLQPYA